MGTKNKLNSYQEWVKKNYSYLSQELFNFGLEVWDYCINNYPFVSPKAHDTKADEPLATLCEVTSCHVNNSMGSCLHAKNPENCVSAAVRIKNYKDTKDDPEGNYPLEQAAKSFKHYNPSK
jgi:hypothetical protein